MQPHAGVYSKYETQQDRVLPQFQLKVRLFSDSAKQRMFSRYEKPQFQPATLFGTIAARQRESRVVHLGEWST